MTGVGGGEEGVNVSSSCVPFQTWKLFSIKNATFSHCSKHRQTLRGSGGVVLPAAEFLFIFFYQCELYICGGGGVGGEGVKWGLAGRRDVLRTPLPILRTVSSSEGHSGS